MFRTKRNDEADTGASSARDGLRQAAAQVTPVAARMKPLARSTGLAARRGARRTRAWAAPQVERTGQVLQDSVAPKVSALLSSAAQRLEPAEPPRRRWRKLAGISMITAAASAVGAGVPGRTEPEPTTPGDAEGGDGHCAPGAWDGEAGAAPGGAGGRTRPRPLPSPPPLVAGRTPADTCGDHCDDEKHRPGDDARKATARVPPRQVGSAARDERRRRLRGLREVDDAPGYGQDAEQHKDLGPPSLAAPCQARVRRAGA